MKRLTFLAFCLFSLLNLQAFATEYNKVVIFGDSLSDNGNMYNYSMHLIPNSPPYFEGRFSNGPVWSEYIAGSKGTKTEGEERLLDYAVGGAGAIISKDENLPYSLSAEISNFLYLHTYEDKSKMLYSLWIGANNYINGPTNIEEITDAVVEGIHDNLEMLIKRNAKNFLIFTLPDFGESPQGMESGNPQLLSTLVKVHNSKLKNMVEELKANNPTLKVVLFDIIEVINDLKNHPEIYGLTNTTEPCYLGGYMLRPHQANLITWLSKQATPYQLSSSHIESLLSVPDYREATRVAEYFANYKNQEDGEDLNCDNYLYWDHLHPSAKAHEILASLVAKRLKEEGFVFNKNA